MGRGNLIPKNIQQYAKTYGKQRYGRLMDKSLIIPIMKKATLKNAQITVNSARYLIRAKYL